MENHIKDCIILVKINGLGNGYQYSLHKKQLEKRSKDTSHGVSLYYIIREYKINISYLYPLKVKVMCCL